MQPSGALQSWMRIHRLVFRLKRCWLVHAGWYASLRLHEGHFHPEADLEFGHALSHDHQVGSEIVPDLINQGETSIALICRDTKLYPVTRAPNVRNHVTRQFPYNLIYRVVETFPQVQESMAVAQDWEGDTRVLLFITLREGEHFNEELEKAIRSALRSQASPRHVPDKIIVAPELPRTKSNKLVELAVGDVINGREVRNRGALLNPQALDWFKVAAENEFNF